MTKEEAKKWVEGHILLGTKPVRGKYVWVPAFSSNNAKRQIVEHLAGKMCEELETVEQASHWHEAYAKSEHEKHILEAKILLWHANNKSKEFDIHFGISTARKGSITKALEE